MHVCPSISGIRYLWLIDQTISRTSPHIYKMPASFAAPCLLIKHLCVSDDGYRIYWPHTHTPRLYANVMSLASKCRNIFHTSTLRRAFTVIAGVSVELYGVAAAHSMVCLSVDVRLCELRFGWKASQFLVLYSRNKSLSPAESVAVI